MRRLTTYPVDIPDLDEPVELEFEPMEDGVLHRVVGDKLVVCYLTHDGYREDLMEDDYSGKLLSGHRMSMDHRELQEALGLDSSWEPDLDLVFDRHTVEALRRYAVAVVCYFDNEDLLKWAEAHYDRGEGEDDEELITYALSDDMNRAADRYRWQYLEWDSRMQDILEDMWGDPEFFPGDPDAVALDCYEHGSQWWSLSGQGMQCPWDTARSAGVWVPSKHLKAQMDADGLTGAGREAQCRLYALQFLEDYNAVNNGDVWGCIAHVYEADTGKFIEAYEEVWGFVGHDYAEEALKTEFFEPACRSLLAKHEEEIRTQCGRQKELELCMAA